MTTGRLAMIRITELKLALDAAFDRPDAATPPPLYPPSLPQLVADTLGVAPSDIAHWQVFKRSFDARKAKLQVVYIVDVQLLSDQQQADCLARHAGNPHIFASPDMTWHAPVQAPADWAPHDGERPVVIGFGPCGMFAALVLAQMGLKPIVIERGRRVRQRTKDTWGLWRQHVLQAESNVQFGEGGAGTFSDGKLYSQIKDPRHLGRKVMAEFVRFGAPEEILWAAHPHIGTFKLVKVVESLREHIIRLGGEIRFEQRVTDIETDDGPDGRRIVGLQVLDLATNRSHALPARHVVLALGHSARDTFTMLHRHGVAMQAKPFSLGFRIEHPQGLIDRARWGAHAGHPMLGAADYKLVHHARNGRSVYSFCMCPGGTVVAATSEPGRVVTNGMSQYSRNERNANAGLVVGIDPRDHPTDPALFEALLGPVRLDTADATGGFHPLGGVVLQRQWESRAYELGGSDYSAPGQCVGDFVAGRASTGVGGVEPSYKPGVRFGSLDNALPTYAIDALREAIPAMARKLKGFDQTDAVLTGVETRTSSPLRIERDANHQSPNVRGLYPAGEGAGFAGGILSAAVDGIKVGESVARGVLL
jgi:uncharacterized FAD-dependent dehydrogenase